MKESGDIRVEEYRVGSFCMQLVDDADCRRLSVVVDIRLVSDTQYKYSCSVERFAEAAVEYISDTFHTVFRHKVIDLHRCLYH